MAEMRWGFMRFGLQVLSQFKYFFFDSEI
jgi:hypothetical protein